MLIISIVSGAAVLSIGMSARRDAKIFAEELTQKLTLASEQAILQRQVIGLFVENDKVFFTYYEKNEKTQEENWVPFENRSLGEMEIPSRVEMLLTPSSQDEMAEKYPQITISTNGDPTPFTIYIGRKGDKPGYAIIGSPDGNIVNKPLG